MSFANLTSRLKAALKEDAAFSDVTTNFIPGVRKSAVNAKIIAKAEGVLCGTFLISTLFKMLDRRARVRILRRDGERVKPGQTVALIRAKTSAILSGERLLLNLLCHLSGVATLTHRYVVAVKYTAAKILDTRKTTPLWRDLEKYAVRCGGGKNHRFSLGDAVLIKDNHLEFLGDKKIAPLDVYGPSSEVRKKNRNLKFIAMEATNYREVWEAIKLRADIILLDNMPLNRLKGSVVFIKAAREALKSPKPLIEVSGGVTIAKAKQFAQLGVDRISVGALTHSAPTLDLSLEVF